MEQLITRRQAMRKILKARKTIIGVGFTKTDGSKRFMALRRETLVGIKGDDACDSAKKARRTRKKNNPHLISVLELRKGVAQWRTLNLLTLFSLRVNGESFSVA
jgi:hypothetical protein